MFQQQPAAGSGAPSGPRAAADDSDLWNLAPASSDVLAEVDLAALRASPWSHALTESGLSGQREEARRLYGYDIFAEGERLLAVMSEAGGTPRSMTIVRGTFDPARVGCRVRRRDTRCRRDALARQPAVGGWQDGRSRWSRRGRWSRASRAPCAAPSTPPGAWSPTRGRRRSAPCGARSTPTIRARVAFVALNVTDGMRARAAGFVDLPPRPAPSSPRGSTSATI